MIHNVYAITRIDFFTAWHILQDHIGYALLKGRDSSIIDENGFADEQDRRILVRSYIDAQYLLQKYTDVVVIICMTDAEANLLQIEILDTPKGIYDIPEIDIKRLIRNGRKSQPTTLPLVNLNVQMISTAVEDIQKDQILSHVNSLFFALTKAARSYMQQQFLLWLERKITTKEFHDGILPKLETAKIDVLTNLITFMSSAHGLEYQRVFSAIFAGKTVKHKIPPFEITYFTIARKKGEKKA